MAGILSARADRDAWTAGDFGNGFAGLSSQGSPIDLAAIALAIAAVAEIGRCLGSRTWPAFVSG